ncbi:LuxR family transcriptional regulator [Agromyces rhizosphaerae]|uniref:LuxR family transcriptional regulator n=1 Tax=Agromyces rhizosphaerae TaxID=88374 RepID=A0A9W6CQL1_9MICO|nr:alpha/beta fold hydrolase [Agromyces rhizosphaerae]GLI26713.1 LuxR family transcriptional regulator [Agromyces rhizosphaerae]
MEPGDQLIRYADVGGREVAWTSVGSGPPLVLGGWWCSHLGLDWEGPAFRRLVAALAEHFTVIRYDRPGGGASGHDDPPPADLDEELALLEGVIAVAVGDEVRVSMFGVSSGGAVSSRFAAEHPDRVDALVMYGTFANGSEIAPPHARKGLLDVIGTHWGFGSRVLADLFLPEATAEERDEFVAYQRRSASRESAAASMAELYAFDSTGHLGRVRAPTLVLHRREDRAIPFALGADVASRIPGARFVELHGLDHFPWRGDQRAVTDEVLRFLGVDPGPRTAADPGASVTEPPVADLSPREIEVLRLVARGDTDQQIAQALVLSPHTVHRHLANIRTKLGVPSRAAAAAWASRHDVL